MPLASPINYQQKAVGGDDCGHELPTKTPSIDHVWLSQVTLHCFFFSVSIVLIFKHVSVKLIFSVPVLLIFKHDHRAI